MTEEQAAEQEAAYRQWFYEEWDRQRYSEITMQSNCRGDK